MASENIHPQSSVTDRIAELIVSTSWASIPAHVKHEAKRSLINYFAAALGGCGDPAITCAANVFRRFSADSKATITGRRERTDMVHAANLNAMSANVLDFDDTHIPTIIHPTAPIASALFALGESQTITGEQLLLALILGVEVSCRLGRSVHPDHYKRGWHITSTCGIFGVAAAVSKALMLDQERTTWALGNASAQASGLVETIGSMSKSLGVGNSASNGLLSALFAEGGFNGPAAPLEGTHGYLRTSTDEPKLELITKDLGKQWELESNTYKPYPCGVVLNAVIDACFELLAQGELVLADIESIEIVGHPLLRERADRPLVKTGRASKVSAQHAVAVVLLRGLAGVEEFSDAATQDAHVRELGSRVVFVDDESFTVESARVTLTMKDSAPRIAFTERARGSLMRPLSDTDLEIKLTTLCFHGGSDCVPEPLIDAIWTIEDNPDISSVMALAAGRV